MHAFQELLLPSEFQEAEKLLEVSGLDMPEGITFGLGAYEDGVLAGAGFLAGNVVCGICVSPESQGAGLAAAIVSRLVQHALLGGQTHLSLFTKPTEAAKFDEIGFHTLASTSSAAFLEWGRPNYAAWLHEAKEALDSSMNAPGADAILSANGVFDFPLGAIVMNANPFTLGHRHLVLQALARCRRVVVFVVEEDASTFPFTVRYALVREGLADQERVTVRPGGSYMVSRASFPSYFSGKAAHSRVHAELDCTLFASRIAPDLGIAARFAGEEPYCEVTAAYNAIMRDTLPRYGVECLEIPRLALGDTPISASAVRALLGEKESGQKENVQKTMEHLVPASTAAFFKQAEAKLIVEELQRNSGRH